MDNYYSKDSEGEISGEFMYDNPFLLEDDKFEKEFEKTLALFDALLIGEDSLSDTFSLSSSPSSTLKFKPPRIETKSYNILNDNQTSVEASAGQNISNGSLGEERPKSFLHDEVSEFNRLLKELSESTLLNRHSSSSTLQHPNKLGTIPTHHHSFSVPEKSFQRLGLVADPTKFYAQSKLNETESSHDSIIKLNETESSHDSIIKLNQSESLDDAIIKLNKSESPNDLPNKGRISASTDSKEPRIYFPSEQNSTKRRSFKNILESGFIESLNLFRPQDSSTLRIHKKSTNDDEGSFSLGSSFDNQFNYFPLGFHGNDDLTQLNRKKDDSDSAYQTGSTDTLKSTASSSSMNLHHDDLSITEDVRTHNLFDVTDLEERIVKFNGNKAGLFVEMSEKSIYSGSIRVHLNLTRPISMRLPVPSLKLNASSLFQGCHGDEEADGERMVKITSFPSLVDSSGDDEGSLSSLPSLPHSLPEYSNRYAHFYVPPNVSKVIHVTSESMTTTVIKTLINKFQIVNNSNGFALFLRTYDKPAHSSLTIESGKTVQRDEASNHSNLNLSRPLTCHMRKLSDDERPLEMLMRAVDEAGVEAVETTQFVLQEYSSGEIIWDAFSIPELRNFVAILTREEEMKMKEVEERYSDVRTAIKNRIKRLEGRMDGEDE